MKVCFDKVIVPCVVNDVTLWHVEHGWLWDVVEVQSNRHVAVFFCTLLCGDGCILHFYPRDGVKATWQTVLAAMRKAVRMVAPAVNVVYATVEEDNQKLINCLIRFGFGITDAGFRRNGKNILLLKYFPHTQRYINSQK